jgi:hypothetical protein
MPADLPLPWRGGNHRGVVGVTRKQSTGDAPVARVATATSTPQSCSQRAGGETCSPDRANHLYPICLLGVQTESRPKLKRPPHLGGGRTSARLPRVCATRCLASRYATTLYLLPVPMSTGSRFLGLIGPGKPTGERPSLPRSNMPRSVRRQKSIAQATVILRPHSSPKRLIHL